MFRFDLQACITVSEFANGLDEMDEAIESLFCGLCLDPEEYILLDIPEYAWEEVKGLVPGNDPAEENCVIFTLPRHINNDDCVEDVCLTFKMGLQWTQFNDDCGDPHYPPTI